MSRLLALLAALVVAGCGEAPAPKAKRLRNPAPVVATETSHEMRDGQIVVLDVPVKNSMGRTEVQRCFVWRERAGGSSLQCPSDGYDLPPSGDASDVGGQPNY